MLKKSSLLLVLVSILSCVFIAGCGRPVLFSECRNSVITIDGKYTDWGNARTYYDEKEKVILNLLNDKEYLYICLVTRNLDIEYRLMESGLSLWFDPSGKKNRNFGVRFPIGMMVMGMPMEEEDKGPRDWRGEGDREYHREGEEDRGAEFEKKLETLEGLQYKLQLLKGPFGKKKAPGGPANKEPLDGLPKDKPEEMFLEEADKLGIEARIGRQNGYFVYELKVPVAKSAKHPDAIEAKAGEPIGLGVEIENGLQLWLTVVLSPGCS